MLAAVSAVKAVIINSKFLAYLKRNHYRQWNDFIGDETTDLIKHIYFVPLGSKKSYFSFIFKSSEDFSDQQVRDYKRSIRHGIYGFLVNAIAGCVGFGLTAYLLTQMSP